MNINAFTLALLLGNSVFIAHANESEKQLLDVYDKEKERVIETDEKSRITLSMLYQINQKMKIMSRKRSNLTDRLLTSESRTRKLTKDVVELENKIKRQRKILSSRLRAIYMLGDDMMARIIFSSSNAQDLDQSLMFLKKISENDYKNIKNYEKTLKALSNKKENIKTEVKALLNIKANLEKQESDLTKEQQAKGDLLDKLMLSKKTAINNIKNIRSIAEHSAIKEEFDISFFEKRGQLSIPVEGYISQDFGLIKNSKYKYELSHKGLTFDLAENSPVRAIHNGRVGYVGRVAGYGNTVVIDHGDHYYTVYSNLKDVMVKENEKMFTDAIIARSNSEIYFEIRHFSDAINPHPWFVRNK